MRVLSHLNLSQCLLPKQSYTNNINNCLTLTWKIHRSSKCRTQIKKGKQFEISPIFAISRLIAKPSNISSSYKQIMLLALTGSSDQGNGCYKEWGGWWKRVRPPLFARALSDAFLSERTVSLIALEWSLRSAGKRSAGGKYIFTATVLFSVLFFIRNIQYKLGIR